jgi:hypothetical protein
MKDIIQVVNFIKQDPLISESEFNHYNPKNASKYSWVPNPFNIGIEDLLKDITNILKLQKQHNEIQSEEMPLYDFKKESARAFWIKVKLT